MCGGGESNTVTQTQVRDPARNIKQAGQTGLDMATQAAQQQFQAPVQPVAPFTPYQTQAFNQVAALQGMTDPYYSAAKTLMGEAGTEVTPEDIERYLNPYRNDVLANMNKYIFGPQRVQTMGQARQRAGGPSADRLALTSQNLDFTQADALSQALAGFYNPAMQQAQRSKEMALQTAMGWGNLGTSAQNAALQATGALGTAGNQQQAQAQAELMAPYNWELAKLAYPFQTANFMLGAANTAAPTQRTTQTGTTTYPTPSPLNQIVGLGTSALGAYMGMPGAGMGKGSSPSAPYYGQSYNMPIGTGYSMPVFANRGGRIGYASGGRSGYAKGGGAGDFTSGMTGQGNPFPTMPTNPTAMPQGVANLSSMAAPAMQPNLPNQGQQRPFMQAMQDWREQGRPRGFWRDWITQNRDQFPQMPQMGNPGPGGPFPPQAMPTMPMIPPGATPPIYAGNNPYQTQLGQMASGFADGGDVSDIVPDPVLLPEGSNDIAPMNWPAIPTGGGSSGGGKGATGGGSAGMNDTEKAIAIGLKVLPMLFGGPPMPMARGGRSPSDLLSAGMKLAADAMGGAVNPYDIGQGFQEGGEIDDFSSRWSALTPPEQDPPTTFPDRWNAAVEAEREGAFQPQGGQTPPLRPMGPKVAAPPPQEAPSVAPPVERPQVAVNPGPRLIPPRPPRDPSVDLERLILPRERMPYPDATERDWGQRMVRSPWAALIPAGAKIAQTVGPLGSAIGAGVGEGFKELGAQRKELRSEEAINQRAQELYRRAQAELRYYQKSRFQQMPYTTGEGHPLAFETSTGRTYNAITGETVGRGVPLSQRTTTNRQPALVSTAEWMVKNGLAPDLNTAFDRIKQSASNKSRYDSLVKEYVRIMMTADPLMDIEEAKYKAERMARGEESP